MSSRLGTPRVHFRRTGSTNERARELAWRGAPHGTLVTAAEQTTGRGRQGRTWTAAPGRAILASLVIRDPPRLLPLAAGVAVADVVGPDARVKWPNDVLVEGASSAGSSSRVVPRSAGRCVGIGLNVAGGADEFPPELRERAGTMGLEPEAIEPTLARLLEQLDRWIVAPAAEVLDALRRRDALAGSRVRWAGGEGEAAGIDEAGRLVVC